MKLRKMVSKLMSFGVLNSLALVLCCSECKPGLLDVLPQPEHRNQQLASKDTKW